MSHSANCGFTQELWPVLEWMARAVPCTQCLRWKVVQRLRESFAQLPLASMAWGVGNNPDAVSLVWGSNGGRRYNVPLSIIPERGKVSQNSSSSPSKQSCDVLHDDDVRSNFANKSPVMGPESASLACEPSPLSRNADILAREPTADDVDVGNSIPSKSVGAEFSNVFIYRHPRPMLGQYAPTERLNLAESHGFKSTCALKPKGESTDAAKEVERFQHPSFHTMFRF